MWKYELQKTGFARARAERALPSQPHSPPLKSNSPNSNIAAKVKETIKSDCDINQLNGRNQTINDCKYDWSDTRSRGGEEDRADGERKDHFDDLGREMAQQSTVFSSSKSAVPELATTFPANFSGDAGRQAGRVRIHEGRRRLVGDHDFELLDGRNRSCEVHDEEDSNGVCFYGQRRTPHTTNNSGKRGRDSSGLSDTYHKQERPVGSRSRTQFHPGPEDWGHLAASAGTDQRDNGFALEHDVYDHSIRRGKDDAASRPVHASPAEYGGPCDETQITRDRRAQDALWRGYDHERFDYSVGLEDGISDPLAAVHPSRWLNTNVPEGGLADNAAASFEARHRANADEIPRVGRALLCPRSRTHESVLGTAAWPLHIKHVPPLNEALLMSEMSTDELRRYKQIRGFFEPAFLETVPCTGNGKCYLSSADVNQLLRAGLFELCDPPDRAIPEWTFSQSQSLGNTEGT